MSNTLSQTFRLKLEDLHLKRKSIISEWILFLIHPVSALVLAIVNYKSSFAKNIVWLFVAYYGFTMVIPDEGMDASSYRDNFLGFTTKEITVKNFVDMLYQEGSNYVDAAEPLISFLVSRFTSNTRILFMVFGLIFGYFYSRNIWFLIERISGDIKKTSLIYILVFTVIIGFWQINGFRMWTAAHIFFFGAIQYLFDNKKSGILISASSILFHFSFMFPVSLLILFTVLPKKISVIYWFFIISSFLSEINIEVVSNTLTNLLPGVFHSRVQGYTSLEYVQVVAEDLQAKNWRYILYGKSIKWVAIVFLSVIYFNGVKFVKDNHKFNVLFCFALYFMAIINLVSNVPSVGRFYSVAYLFAFAFIFLYTQQAPYFSLKKAVNLFSLPLLFFYCLGMINIALMTIGLVTVIGNPAILFFPLSDIDISISDFIP